MEPEKFVIDAAPDGSPTVEVTVSDAGYSIFVRGIGTFTASAAGALLTSEPDPSAPEQDVADVRDRWLEAALGQLRGRPCIHGSAVAFGGRGLAFVGASGMGKSTLASVLARRGAEVVSDDGLMFDERAGGWHLMPASADLRLRPPSVEGLRVTEPVRLVREKSALRFQSPRAPVPLGRVFLLGPDVAPAAVIPLGKRDAVAALAPHVFRLDPRSATLLGRELEFLGDLVRDVPVATLRYPRRFDQIDALADLVLATDEAPR